MIEARIYERERERERERDLKGIIVILCNRLKIHVLLKIASSHFHVRDFSLYSLAVGIFIS